MPRQDGDTIARRQARPWGRRAALDLGALTARVGSPEWGRGLAGHFVILPPMTMPHERLLAVRRGTATLAALAEDAVLDEQIRNRAQTLQRRHPTQTRLAELLASGEPMSASMADALRDTFALLSDVRYSGAGSDAIRNAVVNTLLHYPDTMEIQALRQAVDLRGWLAEEARA